MERIQAAIAKARAARRGDRVTFVEDSAQPETASAWEALPFHEVQPKRMEDNRLLVGQEGAQTAEGAAFDIMRTRVFQIMRENGWKRVAITSPTPQCGKSTVAINLGLSLARRTDVSAIIIEADMRRPSLAKKLGFFESHSVADVLRGTSPFGENAFRITERLAVSTSSVAIRNPSDLLQSPNAGEALSRIERQYTPTLMLFDMPPLQSSDDTTAFLPFVDCVILIAAAEHTTSKQIDECERDLASHTNVLGVVLNKCKFAGPKYGYTYDY